MKACLLGGASNESRDVEGVLLVKCAFKSDDSFDAGKAVMVCDVEVMEELVLRVVAMISR